MSHLRRSHSLFGLPASVGTVLTRQQKRLRHLMFVVTVADENCLRRPGSDIGVARSRATDSEARPYGPERRSLRPWHRGRHPENVELAPGELARLEGTKSLPTKPLFDTLAEPREFCGCL